MSFRETPLVSRSSIEAMYAKLQNRPECDSICPRCLTPFKPLYEACYCKEYGVNSEKDWEDVFPNIKQRQKAKLA
jgi:hypothetical protein